MKTHEIRIGSVHEEKQCSLRWNFSVWYAKLLSFPLQGAADFSKPICVKFNATQKVKIEGNTAKENVVNVVLLSNDFIMLLNPSKPPLLPFKQYKKKLNTEKFKKCNKTHIQTQNLKASIFSNKFGQNFHAPAFYVIILLKKKNVNMAQSQNKFW